MTAYLVQPQNYYGMPRGHHGKIMSNGDYVDKFGNVIDNIKGYIP